MALTTTYVTGAVSATPAGPLTQITLNAYTAPTVGPNGPRAILQFATGEQCLVTDSTLSPTLSVVRGWNGTQVVAHKANEAVQYGLPLDFSGTYTQSPLPTNQNWVQWESFGSQEITATGATGTTAGLVIAASPGFLSVTGASGAGINLPYPTTGMAYWVRNNMTGVLNVYCVGGKINGTTGTTALAISATGDLGAGFFCSTAGSWQTSPSAT